MQRIAIYDMDKTITRRPTYAAFLMFAALRVRPWRLLLAPATLVTGLLYVLGVLDRAALKERNQTLMLGRSVPHALLAPAIAQFTTQTLTHNVLAGARAQIATDRAQGWTVVMATASYRLYAEPIAQVLGFDAVVATDIVRDGDMVHARIDGENCYGPAKLRMVMAWLDATHRRRSDVIVRFYSDHISDSPCFEWADEPVAVNAHAPLKAKARALGWACRDWPA